MRLYCLCFLNGALLTLGFAPYGLWPLGFIAIPNILRALQSAPTASAGAWRGFAFGYGYFMAGTWWIGNALLVDADKFAWMLPFSVFGLSALMALWFALMGYVFVRCFSSFHRGGSIVCFAVLWVAIEYLRSFGMFGFPWNLLGSMAVSVPALMQSASLVGTYGLSLLLLLLFTLPSGWMALRASRRENSTMQLSTDVSRHFRSDGNMVLIVATLVLIGIAYGYGSWRMPPEVSLTKTSIRIVQGNIAQSLKWSPQGEREAERVYSELTQAPASGGAIPKIIIWPETAVPTALRHGAIWPMQVGQLLPRNGILLTGALRYESTPKKKLWNSLLAINEYGVIRATYDKHQRVPFGEFVPLRDTLPLEKITPGNLDFSRGEGIKTMVVDAAVPPFRPLICYEVIFPWFSQRFSPSSSESQREGEYGQNGDTDRSIRPQWLLNITNDAWYGKTPGPYQHLVAAQLRAVEQGLPLVRVANTGISAFIDPYGRVVRALPLGERGFIDQRLPAALPLTFYARWGERVTLGLLMGMILGAFYGRQRLNRQ